MADPLRAVRIDERAVCPLAECDGSGWILGTEDIARPCRCREPTAKRRRRRGVNSELPPRFRDVSLSLLTNDGTDPTALRAVRTFIDGMDESLAEGSGLWLSGPVGNGKTSLGMLVSKSALEAGHAVAIYSTPKLLTSIRATFQENFLGESYSRFFERLTSVDLLHIDDLGAERQTEWVIEQLYAIINERYEQQRSMLVTTNLDEDELREQLGDRIVSRLLEMCALVLVRGDDRRPHLSPEI